MPIPPSAKTIDQLPGHTAVELTGAEEIPLYGPSWATGTQTGKITVADFATYLNAVPPPIAANTLYGNNTLFTAPPVALTPTQVKTLLAISASDVSGLGSLATLSAAPAGTLTGTTLNATVVNSSLTSVGTLTGGATGAGFAVNLGTSTISGLLPAANFPALTGDVTNTAGAVATTISAGSVTLAKMANLAANSIIGNNTGSATTPLALTPAQVKTLLAIASTDVSGLGTLATLSAAPAGTLTGTTLNATVVNSSLTSVGTLTGGATGAGFTVALSTSTITGTLADARLSSNVALKGSSNQFTAAQYVTTGGLNVGLAVAPKGTGNQLLEVAGTGTGAAAFGSLALSRADGTSSSIAGSIDFYTVTTLAGQIQCNQISGGGGGVNYLSFNLGAAGTLKTAMQLQWTNGSLLGALLIGAFNGTFHGQLQICNFNAGNTTTAILLTNSSPNTANTRSAIDWRDGNGSVFARVASVYSGTQQSGDLCFSVGTGVTNGLQDFVRLTNTGRMDFYLLDSVSNRKVGGLYAQWQNPVDATRAGQINFTAMNTTNELIAFYYWADSSTSTRMAFNANTISFLGTGSVNFAGGIQMPSTTTVLFNTDTASVGTPLTNSASIRFGTSYWNGAASTAGMITTLQAQQVATFTSGVQLVLSVNPGAGATNMFAVGSNTTVETSLVTLGAVLTATNLAYNAFSVFTSWLDNAAATRRSSVNFNAWYITTAQKGFQIDGVAAGSQPNVSLVLGSTAASYGSGVGVVFIANRGTAPSGTPVGGGILFVEAGALKFTGSAGTTSTVAVA